MKRNLVGSIYGRYSIKIAHFVPIRHKYGCHRQFLFLIGQFLKKISSSETVGAVAIIRQSDSPIVRQSDSPTNALN